MRYFSSSGRLQSPVSKAAIDLATQAEQPEDKDPKKRGREGGSSPELDSKKKRQTFDKYIGEIVRWSVCLEEAVVPNTKVKIKKGIGKLREAAKKTEEARRVDKETLDDLAHTTARKYVVERTEDAYRRVVYDVKAELEERELRIGSLEAHMMTFRRKGSDNNIEEEGKEAQE